MALISRPSSSSCYHQFILVVFQFFFGLTSASTFLSDAIFHSSGASTRSLLQDPKGCSVDFEHANYTGLISQCKGPDYPPTPCCDAFKQFACPYAHEINDVNTNCAKTMFSYINLYGKFPPGLFANECREGDDGLACATVPPAAAVSSETVKSIVNSTSHASSNRATFLVATVSMVSLLQIL